MRLQKILYLAERDIVMVAAVVEVGVRSVGHYQQLLVAARQLLESVLAHVSAVRLLAVHDKDGVAQALRMSENLIVCPAQLSLGLPPGIGVYGVLVISALGLVVCAILLNEVRQVLRLRHFRLQKPPAVARGPVLYSCVRNAVICCFVL